MWWYRVTDTCLSKVIKSADFGVKLLLRMICLYLHWIRDHLCTWMMLCLYLCWIRAHLGGWCYVFVQNISLLFIHVSLLSYTVDCHSFLASKPLQNSDHYIGVIQNKIENRKRDLYNHSYNKIKRACQIIPKIETHK